VERSIAFDVRTNVPRNLSLRDIVSTPGKRRFLHEGEVASFRHIHVNADMDRFVPDTTVAVKVASFPAWSESRIDTPLRQHPLKGA